ncbi:ImmA/IrrE family metallo-endopeptidase [Enterococcus alishanensis]
MQDISELLKRNGIELSVSKMDSPGFYVPKLKIMFVNEELDIEQQRRVILHETKHAIDHTDFYELYKIPIFHMKMETDADSFMINYLIKENDGQYNYSQLIEEFNLGLGWEHNLH